jgi:hypothetical protein
VVSAKVPREEFRHPSETVINRPSERAGIVADLLRGLFRDGQTDGTMPPATTESRDFRP